MYDNHVYNLLTDEELISKIQGEEAHIKDMEAQHPDYASLSQALVAYAQ